MRMQMNKIRYGLLLACLAFSFISNVSFAALIGGMPLPADKAFAFSTTVSTTGTIQVKWDIAPGYYIYKQRIHFKFSPSLAVDIQLPKSILKQVSRQPAEEVYYGKTIAVLSPHAVWKQATLHVDYQGCSDRGFCYPPMSQTVGLHVPAHGIAQQPTALAPPQNRGTDIGTLPGPIETPASYVSQSASVLTPSLLTHQNEVQGLFTAPLNLLHLIVLLLIFTGLGALLAFTPCVLPMVPILASIILGQKQPVSLRRSLSLSSTYVLGSAITYAAAGVAAALMGSSLQAWLQQPWIIAGVSLVLGLLALSLFGVYDLQLPRAWQNQVAAISRNQKGGTYLGVFVMGIVSTLVVSPCVTAPLAGVLMYIAKTGNIFLGASALFAMGVGMGVPLILLGISAGKWLPRRGPWMSILQKGVGLSMLGIALWLLTRAFAATVIVQISGILLIAIALYYIVVHQAPRMRHFTMGLIGTLLIVSLNVPAVKDELLTRTQAATVQSFVIVHNLDDLNQQLAMAKTLNKPVLLDFYANWCESCVAMDKNVFSLPDVIKTLNHFILLRADLSANNEEDAALLKNYDVIAPPTILFFNNEGKEIDSQRIIGELSAQEFLTRIHTFITASSDKK